MLTQTAKMWNRLKKKQPYIDWLRRRKSTLVSTYIRNFCISSGYTTQKDAQNIDWEYIYRKTIKNTELDASKSKKTIHPIFEIDTTNEMWNTLQATPVYFDWFKIQITPSPLAIAGWVKKYRPEILNAEPNWNELYNRTRKHIKNREAALQNTYRLF